MIENSDSRRAIAFELGEAIDILVRDRMKGLVEEPDITSRIGQMLEYKFDGKLISGYRVRVITETIPSHGVRSLEKPMGTDLYIAISSEDRSGKVKSKAVLVQAKRDNKINKSELTEQCRRMTMITKKGSVVWIYTKNGVNVIRSTDVERRSDAVFRNHDLFERVFECMLIATEN